MLAIFVGAYIVGCGSSDPATPPSPAYIYSDASHLMYMQWSAKSQDQIAGSFYQVEYSSGNLDNTTVPITGSVGNGIVTLQSSGITLYTGEIHSAELDIDAKDDQGQATTERWHQTDRGTYNQLVAAFTAHIETTIQLKKLADSLSLLPTDSDPSTPFFQAQRVQSDIDLLQANWNDVVAAQQSQRCAKLQYLLLFYPYKGSFQAEDPNDSTLAHQISQVDQKWTYAKTKPVPIINGLSYAWKVSATEVKTADDAVKTKLSALSQADTNAQKQLDLSKQQYDLLSAQIETAKKNC